MAQELEWHAQSAPDGTESTILAPGRMPQAGFPAFIPLAPAFVRFNIPQWVNIDDFAPKPELAERHTSDRSS